MVKAAGWRWDVRTLPLLSFPCPLLCLSAATLAFLTGPRRPGRLQVRRSVRPAGAAGGVGGGMGLSAHRPLPLVELQKRALPLAPGDGSCWLWGPA